MEVATFGGRGATRWPRLLLALSCLSSASAFATDTALCAACYNSYRQLAGVLNKTKTDLELSKEANDKKAAKVDKVQKAQTKRWLKNEYGVALRAALEEEMEVLCSRDTMTATPALQSACSRFVEANEDDLSSYASDDDSDFMLEDISISSDETAEDDLAYMLEEADIHDEEPEEQSETAKLPCNAPRCRLARKMKLVTGEIQQHLTKCRRCSIFETDLQVVAGWEAKIRPADAIEYLQNSSAKKNRKSLETLGSQNNRI